VSEQAFEVGLSFGGVPERVVVPFEAVTAFYDPAVQFGFQFETIDGVAEPEEGEAPAAAEKMEKTEKSAPIVRAAEDKRPEALPVPSEDAAPTRDQGPGGEVVRLDRFRKK
jgi:uncharacterized protein